MRQEWFCDVCQRAGSVSLPKHAGIFETIDRLKRAHDHFANPCQDPKIRMRDPEVLTRIEWRRQVSEWRKVA